MSIILGVLILVILFLWRLDAQKTDRERLSWVEERRELLSRIQHPERVLVDPVPTEPVEPPRDTAELAFVGLEVPDFVNVGSVDAAD